MERLARWVLCVLAAYIILAFRATAHAGERKLDGIPTVCDSAVAEDDDRSLPQQTEHLKYASSPPAPSAITGDWLGRRNRVAPQGVTVYGDITQFYQGVTTGGLAQQFKYGGRGDYLIDLDADKLGLWQGAQIDLRAETRLGQDTNRIDGAVAPSNFAMALPLPSQDVTALTGVQFTQHMTDEVSVFAGKLNLLDGIPSSYVKGRRLNYFWDAAMQSNLSRIFLLPSVLGGGFTIRRDDEPVFNFYLLDTHYTPTTSGFPTLFDNGVVMYGEYQLRTDFFRLPGHSALGLLYSNATRTALDTNPYVLLPGWVAGTPLPLTNTAWTVTCRFDQVVYRDNDDPARAWTLNGDYGLTDGNPNPIRWFANLSLVGNSPIRRRPRDLVGVGYYHLGVSQLPVLTALGFSDENGVELFYNIEVKPWFHLTPDFQVLDPSQRSTPTAVLVGLRARLSI
jgi:porin